MSWRTAAKHELRDVGLVTLYFLFCFGLILSLKKLFLAQYHIESYGLSVVVVSALVAAKVVVIMDKTPVGTRFAADQRPVLAALYKTLIYAAVAFLLIFGEQVFHAYRELGALGRALSEIWAHRDRDVMLAKVICVGVTFAAYHLFVETDRRLGEGTLRRVIWSRK